MTGSLHIVGLGPGPAYWLTPEAAHALATASDIVGYHTYLQRVPVREGQRRHSFDNREELDRAHHALALARDGYDVAIVSGGDPGVFAMAAAVFEAIENGDEAWRAFDVRVFPGVTAMLAAAARAGAPLGSDFCAINLSDNLKPWVLIEKRLALACEADFVMALYNPASRARPKQIYDAFALLKRLRDPETPVIFAQAVGSDSETVTVTDIAHADPSCADMRTLVIVGSSTTRVVPRAGGGAWVYSPREGSRR